MLRAIPPSTERCAESSPGDWGIHPISALLSDARMSQTLRLMGRPPDAKLIPDVAAEVCERTASAAVVEGSITSLGNEYVLGLRARNCHTGDVLDEEQAPATRKDDVVKALGQMANRFRTRAANRFRPWRRSRVYRPGDHALAGGLEVLQRGNEGTTA